MKREEIGATFADTIRSEQDLFKRRPGTTEAYLAWQNAGVVTGAERRSDLHV